MERRKGRLDHRKLGITYAVLAALFAAAFLIPYRLSIQSASRGTAMTAMFVVGALFNLGVAVTETRPRFDWIGVRTAGLLAFFTLLGNLGIALALPRIGAGMTSTVMKLQVIMTPLMGVLFLRELMSKRILLGGAAAFLGLLWPQLGQAKLELAGYAAGVLSAFSFAAMQVVTRAAIDRIQPAFVNALRLVMSVVILVLLFSDGRASFRASLELWMYAGLAGILGPGLSRLYLMASVRHLSPSITAIVALVGPIIAFGFGFVFLNERPSPQELLGAIVVLLGVFWVLAPSLREGRGLRG